MTTTACDFYTGRLHTSTVLIMALGPDGNHYSFVEFFQLNKNYSSDFLFLQINSEFPCIVFCPVDFAFFKRSLLPQHNGFQNWQQLVHFLISKFFRNLFACAPFFILNARASSLLNWSKMVFILLSSL